jgi:hypothetical protein
MSSGGVTPAQAVGFGDRPTPRPKMQLIEWKRVDKGSLIGHATILLPNGLQISDVAIFRKDSTRWAQLPSEPIRKADGQPLKDDHGKVRYRSPLKWKNRELQERFSHVLIELIEAQHGPIGGGQ